MNLKGLSVPNRPDKPRNKGITWCIDDGAPFQWFHDVLQSFHRVIDGVKFGWGTALVTDAIDAKMALCREFGVEYSFGGTLFEAYYVQKRLDAFFALVEASRCPVVEISDGTIELPTTDRRQIMRELKQVAKVFAEVGSKNPEEAAEWDVDDWLEGIMADREAGADLIILETRESGTSGLCTPIGELRADLTEGILDAGIDPAWLMFEAPQKQHQTYWIRRIGPSVNLSNIPLSNALNLETMRLGLRSDTFFLIDQPMGMFWS